MGPFNEFQESLVQNAETIQTLSSLRIQQLPDSNIDGIRADLWKLIKGDTRIKVSASNSPLVAGSKVLRHLIPNLMPPIDGTYTANFFVWKNRVQNAPEEMFRDRFPRLVQLARRIENPAAKHLGSAFNTSLSKILDNAIVGYIRLNDLSPDELLD